MEINGSPSWIKVDDSSSWVKVDSVHKYYSLYEILVEENEY